ncbi:hypothetical protein FALBO_8775 [Fusarium albosuccineum]|uniref:Amidoligase n=1 Tax=Fusarium albosuccineum TaxID=1237068 RepID=A0A8H4L8X3_9HYPO|nr:hypothetical protein FALBO_8775 [Fusarium albosuccineum]
MSDTETNPKPTLPSKRLRHSSSESDKAQQSPTKKQYIPSPCDEYTRPPRISFGVELEFLIPSFPQSVGPDGCIKDLAPIEEEKMDVLDVVHVHLKSLGLRARKIYSEDHDDPGLRPKPAQSDWCISADASVEECMEGGAVTGHYKWGSVEISSPAVYAFDQAFELLSAVIRLLTTKLRARVNQTCGLHVHVGNGPHHMDMAALRNYAALLWASEPVLSTLHCPSRSIAIHSRSIRRYTSSKLSEGLGAIDALRDAADGKRWAPRYCGRARKLGEAPVASRQTFRERIEAIQQDQQGTSLEPDWESDDSDWECESSNPFFRPEKLKTQRTIDPIPNKDMLMSADHDHLDNESTARKLPPQLGFPKPAPSEPVSTPDSTARSFMEEGRHKENQMDIRDIITNEALKSRYGPLEILDVGNIPRGWKLAWPGVKEFLACDVGVHQLAYLMKTPYGVGNCVGSNWEGLEKDNLHPGPGKRKGHLTVESRSAGGSLDAEWVPTWAKIQCRLLEWARDAEPSTLMKVVGKLTKDDQSGDTCTYDVLDFLRDLGMYTEVHVCKQRLERAEEAWFECMLLEEPQEESDESITDENSAMAESSSAASE